MVVTDPLETVGLGALMARTAGGPDVMVGLLDGPVALDHPDLAATRVELIPEVAGACRSRASASCRHGTFVAGVLAARRGAPAPAIAPGCTLLVRPVFTEGASGDFAEGPTGEPGATSGALATAIVECVDAGARILNVSAAFEPGPADGVRELEEALTHAARRGVIVVAAAGNDGAMAGSALTRHPWVVPVVAYGRDGAPRAHSNLGRATGARGLAAPGEGVHSLAPEGGSGAVMTGSSVAAPFVTGTAALLWSEFPGATAAEVRHALVSSTTGRRRQVAPPSLNASGAYEALSALTGRDHHELSRARA
ncbi:S8 family serine peptidase [Microbispora sp. NPDC049125]|uniref:S8 family serine peptidase n=1 Tax=Microbispora sp. NPDC049125 TaxID=3154929 RepID=UPI003466449D